ncbi:hypothetical protein O163_08210 [Caldanaerobacter subterraneus subsp. yonseiensis KB-1]|uniref:Uncharacterized protein n=1 Tax=Caldanaerobacter subterraneus subsp. yonseiensis KB-1 TaxID=1388761 RepID=U5CSK8_CALSX|nr:hypothetical protein [Caldanaerobacter subterraneus]ERM91921.1 hypothetical protein O163_08210 [Caldanaerobacter subterraneus subsp. yonseiensis KB-1]
MNINEIEKNIKRINKEIEEIYWLSGGSEELMTPQMKKRYAYLMLEMLENIYYLYDYLELLESIANYWVIKYLKIDFDLEKESDE